MYNRVHVVMAYPAEDDAKDLVQEVMNLIERAVNIRPGLPGEEISFVERERCYHDEDPMKKCELVERHVVEG